MTDLRYIFVHGLAGWGEYDAQYAFLPYWGMFGGDLMKYLRRRGYACRAASVAPADSAWDRACELYAQLSGTRTDYGAAHAKRAGHGRFGPDFTGRPLIEAFDEDTRLVLIGHSFGGATVRLFAHLLAYGDARERGETEGGLSPLFAGGMEKRVFAVVTLAAPHNGTSAYDLYEDPDFDASKAEVSWLENQLAKTVTGATRAKKDGRADFDRAAYDMHIDNALRLNGRIVTLPGAYYFSVPFSASEKGADGIFRPKRAVMEKHIVKSSVQMGRYLGFTRGGFPVGGDWRENDGLVNTVSARAPLHAPQRDFDPLKIPKGEWNILPAQAGDHMAAQGGMFRVRSMRPFYLSLLETIAGLPE